MDSAAVAHLAAQFEELAQRATYMETEIYVFDATQPRDTDTSLPPLQAYIQQHLRDTTSGRRAATAAAAMSSDIRKTTAQQAQQATDTQQQTTEKTQPAAMKLIYWACGLFAVLLAAAIFVIIRKIKKK